QIEQIAATYASQIFWLLVTFGILYFGVARAMLPQVGRLIDKRVAKIGGDLEAARLAQEQASEAQAARDAVLAKAREEAQTLTGQARAEVGSENEARLKSVDAELEASTAAAEARIQASRQAALAEL